MNIREHIINNFKGDDYKALKEAIDESVESKDEITLPGLGVFMEIIWLHSSEETKKELLETLKAHLN